MRGTRRKRTAVQRANYERQRRTGSEASTRSKAVKGKLYRGLMGELLRVVGRGALTVWMLAWRCKRCGYVWPVRPMRRTTGEGAGELAVPKPLSDEPSPLPKKCPGCDHSDWCRDYDEPLEGKRRAGRRRRPVMSRNWADLQPAPPGVKLWKVERTR